MVQNYLGLGISSAIALICAYLSIKRLMAARIIEDTPTSKIRSAHQAYVELMGFTQLGTEEPLLSPLSQTPCLWYRYNIERYQSSGKNSQWRSIESKISQRPYLLNDGTGDCYVYPDRAEVKTHRKNTWQGNERHPSNSSGSHSLFGSRYRYTEELVCSNDLLYVIAQFETRHPASPVDIQQQTM
jgi:hypothetical protein